MRYENGGRVFDTETAEYLGTTGASCDYDDEKVLNHLYRAQGAGFFFWRVYPPKYGTLVGKFEEIEPVEDCGALAEFVEAHDEPEKMHRLICGKSVTHGTQPKASPTGDIPKRKPISREEAITILGDEALRCCRLADVSTMLQEVVVSLVDGTGTSDEHKVLMGMESIHEIIQRELNDHGNQLDLISYAIEHGHWAQEKAA